MADAWSPEYGEVQQDQGVPQSQYPMMPMMNHPYYQPMPGIMKQDEMQQPPAGYSVPQGMENITPQDLIKRRAISNLYRGAAANDDIEKNPQYKGMHNVMGAVGEALGHRRGILSNIVGGAMVGAARDAQMMQQERQWRLKHYDDQVLAMPKLYQALVGLDPKTHLAGAKLNAQYEKDKDKSSQGWEKLASGERIANARIAAQDRMTAVRKTGVEVQKLLGEGKLKVSQQLADQAGTHFQNMDNASQRMTALHERMEPLELALKRGQLSQDGQMKLLGYKQAYQKSMGDYGMKLMEMHQHLAENSAKTFIDKNGVAHYTYQSKDENGQPSGQPFEMQLPTYESIKANFNAPPDYSTMTDDELIKDAMGANEPQQPMPQGYGQTQQAMYQPEMVAQPQLMQPQPGAQPVRGQMPPPPGAQPMGQPQPYKPGKQLPAAQQKAQGGPAVPPPPNTPLMSIQQLIGNGVHPMQIKQTLAQTARQIYAQNQGRMTPQQAMQMAAQQLGGQ